MEETKKESSQSTPHVQVVTKGDSTAKTVLIVIGVLAVLAICCVVLCIFTSFGTSLLATLGLRSSTNELNRAVDEVNKAFDFDVKLKDVVRSGDTYVLTLDITNKAAEEQTFSTLLNLTLVDGAGKDYVQDFFYEIPEGERLDKDIKAGQTISGKIAFTVETDPSSLKLLVRDSFLDTDEQEIRVK